MRFYLKALISPLKNQINSLNEIDPSLFLSNLDATYSACSHVRLTPYWFNPSANSSIDKDLLPFESIIL